MTRAKIAGLWLFMRLFAFVFGCKLHITFPVKEYARKAEKWSSWFCLIPTRTITGQMRIGRIQRNIVTVQVMLYRVQKHGTTYGQPHYLPRVVYATKEEIFTEKLKGNL